MRVLGSVAETYLEGSHLEWILHFITTHSLIYLDCEGILAVILPQKGASGIFWKGSSWASRLYALPGLVTQRLYSV